MASNVDFVQYVCEQISSAGDIKYKRMFSEYGIFCSGKFIAVVCDNQFFVKPTKSGREVLHEIIEQPPYNGAKPYFLIEDLENKELLAQLITATYNELPERKPRNKKVSTIKKA